jgi:glycosyltransferase involved in cell wall biosynthesis
MNIAFVGDTKGRVQYDRYCLFDRVLTDHNIDFFCFKNRKSIAKIRRKAKKYDIIYLASATTFSRLRIRHPRILTSVTSWKILNMPQKRIANILKSPYAVSVNNLGLYEKLKPYRSNIFYLPNCVDTNIFKQNVKRRSLHDPITIGWTGNVDRKEKNYHSILKSVIQRVNINLKGNDKSVKFNLIKTMKGRVKGSRYKGKKEMAKFYNGLDYYLNVSRSEGTPNPCLEAASCGVPLLSTSVGNMPEIIKDGVNGFILKQHAKSIAKKISRTIVDIDNSEYRTLSKNIRNTILDSWSIESRIDLIHEFFKL